MTGAEGNQMILSLRVMGREVSVIVLSDINECKKKLTRILYIVTKVL